jgi:hypothetical protein
MGELQPLWSCTLLPPSSVSKARNLRLGDWVFWDSRVNEETTPEWSQRSLADG